MENVHAGIESPLQERRFLIAPFAEKTGISPRDATDESIYLSINLFAVMD